MTREHPVQVEVISPQQFDRAQLLLRIALAIVLGVVGITGGWLMWLIYLALPVIVSIAVSSTSPERFADEVAPALWRLSSWLVQLSAYMMLLVDRFPTGAETGVHAEWRFTGTPTTGSALLRLLTSIPSGVVLAILSIVSHILWLVAAVFVVASRTIPPAILGYQRGILRWQARLLAYHASLVEEYPPFTLDTEAGGYADLAHAG
jgi:uncharacterized protein DUF4389